MAKIDLSKEVSLQDLKNIKKSFNSKKKAALPSKKGINLVPPKKKKGNALIIAAIALLSVAALAAVAFFGIYKPISLRNQAQAEYDAAHRTYEQTVQAVGDYDAILREYHSYSRDWMENDKTHRYVSVPRETVLKMVDKTIKPAGTLNSLSVVGDTLTVRMSDMTLTEVTQMLTKVEEEPFVSYAFLQQAVSQETESIVVNEDGEEEVVAGPETVVFTVTVNLRKPVEEEAQ